MSNRDRRFLLVQIAIAAVLLALGCSEVGVTNPYDPNAPESVRARGAVSGRALDTGGATLAGVTVTLTGTALTGVTDEAGAFRLTDVPDGSHALALALSGYRPLSVPVLDLALGESRALGDLVLERARGGVRGQLVVEGGGAAELGAVRVSLSEGTAALALEAPADGADPAQGTPFRLADVLAGTQTLTFTLPGYAAPAVEGVVVPADSTVELPAPVVLAPVPAPLDVELRAPTAGEALPPELEVTLSQGGATATVRAAEDGHFRPVAPHAGLATLTVSHPAYERVERPVVVEAPVPGTTQALAPIDLAYAYGRLAGEVQTADCAPTGVAVSVTVSAGTTQAATLLTVPGADTGACTPGAPGGTARFELPGLRAGAYSLRFTSADYREAASPAPVEVLQDAAAAHPKTVLEVAYGGLRGVVVTPLDGAAEGGAPFDRAGTSLVAEGPGAAAAPVDTDADGRFEIPTLRPGLYNLAVTRAGGPFQILRLSAVQVRPGAQTDLGELGLLFATGTLRGHVSLDDAPPPEARAAIAVQIVGPEFALVQADAQGDFIFAGRRLGTYQVTASAPGYAPRSVEATLSQHLETAVTDDLSLPLLPGRIVGTVEYQAVAGEVGLPQVSVAGRPAVSIVAEGDAALMLPHNSFVLDGLRLGTYTVSVAFPPRYRTRTLPGVLVESGRDTVLTGIGLERASGSVEATFALADAADMGAAERARLLSTIQVRLDSETGGLSYTSLADAQGRVTFASALVDRYTLTAALPDYLTSTTSGVEIAADQEVRRIVETLELPINPGRVRGHAAYSDQPDDSAGIRVDVLGTAVGATLDAGGDFDLGGLKAGVYALRVAGGDGYREVTISPVIVVAGEDTELADVFLPPAYGALDGRVTLEGRDDASGAVVQVLGSPPGGGAQTIVANALVNADGTFEVPDVRVGQYTVVAHHPDYVDETANAVSVVVDRTTTLAFALDLDRGGLSGEVALSDGAPIAGAGVLVTLEQTAETVAPDALGRFHFDALAPGVYSVLVTADGYAPENSRPVEVGPGAEASLGAPLLLLDLKAPDAPTLFACDGVDPLPDFPDAPVFVRAAPVMVGNSRRFPVVVGLGADTDPFGDANFDPAAGQGRWEWRNSAGPWQAVPADVMNLDARAACPHNFTVPLKNESAVETLELRAIDADGNVGNSGLILLAADAAAPLWFRVGVDGGRCGTDSAQVDLSPDSVVPPPIGELCPNDARAPRERTPTHEPIPVFDVGASTATLTVGPPANDLGFGCYYLHSEPWPPSGGAGRAAAPTVAAVRAALLDDAGEIDLAAFDTSVCLPTGTQAIAVTPAGSDTLYCVVALDRARRAATMTFACLGDNACGAGNRCDVSRQVCLDAAGREVAPQALTNCVVVRPDDTPPSAVDVFPDGAESRGGRAYVFTDVAADTLDPNFDHYERQGPTADPSWTTLAADHLETVGNQTAFLLDLIPGQSNTVGLRAVDRAGNAGTPTFVTIDDTTLLPVEAGDAAVGRAPSLVGERVAWSRGAGCDPTGQTKTCANDLLVRDELGLLPETSLVAAQRTCAYGCPRTTGGREPLVALMPNGVAYTDYLEAGDNSVVRLSYLHFGPDGQPGTADDGRRPACAADPECAVYVTGSTCVTGRCSLPATYVADRAGTVGTALTGPAAGGAVMLLASNEVQIASAESIAGANNTVLWTLRRFAVDRVSGWARAEESLAQVNAQNITQTVTSVAAIGAGTLFTLADGTLWYWASGQATAVGLSLPSGAAGTSLKALKVLGTGRYVAAILQVYSGATPDYTKPPVAVALDLGPDGEFTRNGGNIVESFRGPGIACNAQSHTCAGAGLTCVSLLAGETCLPQVGYDDAICLPGSPCTHRLVLEAGMDSDLLAWTTQATDEFGAPRAQVLTWRAGIAGASPRVIVDRTGGKLQPSVHLDRVAYVDQYDGAPRIHVAEAAGLGWLQLDARPKAGLAVGRGWVAYASYEAGRPAVLTAPAALPNAPESRTVEISIVEDGVTTTVRVDGANLQGAALVQRINEKLVQARLARPLAKASLTADGRVSLTSGEVGSTTRLSVRCSDCDAAHPAGFGFGAVVASAQGSDANSADSGLYVAPVTVMGPTVAVPTAAAATAAFGQTAWSVGRGYDLAGDLLVTAELTPTAVAPAPKIEIVATDLPFQDPRPEANNTVCETSACLTARRRSLFASTAAGGTLEDLATDGRHTVFAITGGADAGLYVHDAVNGRQLLDATLKCRHVAVTTTQTGANATATTYGCVGYVANRNDPNDQFIRLAYRTNDAGAFSTTTLTIPAASGGPIVGLWLNDTDLVIERQEDGIIRVSTRSAGKDGLFTTGAQSDDVPAFDGRTGVPASPPVDLILGRNGSDPGFGGLSRGQFVYSDSNGIGQAEIYRMRLRGRQIDRLTHDGNTQNYAAFGDAGIAFVDNRYTTTAQGKTLTPPGLTFRPNP